MLKSSNSSDFEQTINILQKVCEQNPAAATEIALGILRITKPAFELDESENGNKLIDKFIQRLEAIMTRTQTFTDVELSIIIPVYNEKDNILALYHRLYESICIISDKVEIIFVNDGSSDESGDLIAQLHELNSKVKLIALSRNFGHQAAITAGIDYSNGQAVILMDADLQDPPEILIEMVQAWRKGADVVYAVRKKRKEAAWKKLAYFSFYRILKLIASIDIPLDSGDFCLMDRKVVNQLKAMPERNRYLRGLRSWVGFKQVALPYERQARFAGEAKYTFRMLLVLALNGIFSFSAFPLRLAVYTGISACIASFFLLIYAVGSYLFFYQVPHGWTSLVIIILFVGGVQFTLLGAIGEYIARIYEEVKQRPNYIVRDFLDH